MIPAETDYVYVNNIITQHAEFSQDLKDYLDENGLEQIRQWENMVTLLFYVLSMLLNNEHLYITWFGYTVKTKVSPLWVQ